MVINDSAILRFPTNFAPAESASDFDPVTYSRPARLAIICGSSAVLWALIIAGGWGLYSLIA